MNRPGRRIASLVALSAVIAWLAAAASARGAEPEKRWYERFEIGGYTQLRYNRLVVSPGAPANEEADGSLASPARFSIRRARLKLEGDPLPFLHVYLQPEFAGMVGESEHVVELRDWYGDIAVDRDKELRVRAGLSKVPYGFENIQSSQDRAPFDRTDAINSATPGERDLGLFVMYAPRSVRERFSRLSDMRHKGSGDYGMVTAGVFNGQGGNRTERNTNKHLVARLAYPFEIGSQTLELGAGGYTGRFVPQRAAGIGGPREVRDVRVHASVFLYPKPIGFQAEYNVGVGPELVGDAVRERPLEGGYAMLIAHVGPTFPYVRGQRYDGGWKSVVNSPRREVLELEVGLEWRIASFLELTGAYVETRRTTNGVAASGRFVRVQLQLDY